VCVPFKKASTFNLQPAVHLLYILPSEKLELELQEKEN
jgi:hypothetical protein